MNEIFSVLETNVPIIKLKINNIPIDLSLARLWVSNYDNLVDFMQKVEVKAELDQEDIDLIVDEKSQKSICAIQNAQILANLVPN